MNNKYVFFLLCLLPFLSVQADSGVCSNAFTSLSRVFSSEVKGVLKVYTVENHAVIELHKHEKGAWMESSYSLWPVDDEGDENAETGEGWDWIAAWDWASELGNAGMLSAVLVVKALSSLGLYGFAQPGYIAINGLQDHELSTDDRFEVSFELSVEQTLDLEAFLEESIEAFSSGARMYDVDAYHCQSFVEDALSSAGIRGGLGEHLLADSLFEPNGTLNLGRLNLVYQTHGLKTALLQLFGEWML